MFLFCALLYSHSTVRVNQSEIEDFVMWYNTHMKKSRTLFIVLGVLFLFLGFTDEPMSLEFALWMFALAFTAPLQKFFSRFPPLRTFFLVGFFVGIFAEFCAVLGTMDVPVGEKVLLSQDPVMDIFFGLFYYGLLMLVWVLLIRRYTYTGKEIFFLTGLLGIATEEVGGVFLNMFINPLAGVPYALIIFCVYGIFPYVAFLMTKGRIISSHHSAGKLKRYGMTILGLFIFIALYGNYILPLLRRIFE